MNEKLTVSKADEVVAVKGMNDILPPDSMRWQWLEQKVTELMKRFAYQNIRTPIVEHTPLFVRGLGEVTDIVEKEMYCFEDRLNGDSLTLRPENTAGVVRAVIEHAMLYDGGKRLFYMGPMFRHERPQRGRYRQFHQIGAEVLGFSGPEIDAELILLANALWKTLELKDVRLEINSLGQPDERKLHRAALIAYFELHTDQLDEDARRRLNTNPLRILDTKNPAMQDLVQAAPKMMDFLGESSLSHLNGVRSILDANGVDYTINPRLVRGMDYYNLTVFEFITNRLGSQGTICGGGRYDYLVQELGGKPAPAVGWALGVERVLELVNQSTQLKDIVPLDAYAIVMDVTALPLAMKCIGDLREHGLCVQMHASHAGSMGSLKSQFKRADASGANFALIFGADEIAKNSVSVKSLRGSDPIQVSRSLSNIDDWASTLQSHTQFPESHGK